MLALLIVLGLQLSSVDADKPQSDSVSLLLNEVLDLDGALHDEATVERARETAMRLSKRVAACPSGANGRDLQCVLHAVLDRTTAVPTSESTAETSTVTSVLANGRGSCAALVGTTLALSERPQSPFDAVVLRDHVLLGATTSGNVYFETVEAGRRLSTSELSRFEPFPPGGPARVPAPEYLAYYADNLAVRLAETDRVDLARRFFAKATSVSPTAARIHYNFGTFLLQQGEMAQAERELTRAIRFGWKDATAYVNRGAARWRMSRIKAARRDFRKALKLDPRNRDAAANLRRLDGEPGSSSAN